MIALLYQHSNYFARHRRGDILAAEPKSCFERRRGISRIPRLQLENAGRSSSATQPSEPGTRRTSKLSPPAGPSKHRARPPSPSPRRAGSISMAWPFTRICQFIAAVGPGLGRASGLRAILFISEIPGCSALGVSCGGKGHGQLHRFSDGSCRGRLRLKKSAMNPVCEDFRRGTDRPEAVRRKTADWFRHL